MQRLCNEGPNVLGPGPRCKKGAASFGIDKGGYMNYTRAIFWGRVPIGTGTGPLGNIHSKAGWFGWKRNTGRVSEGSPKLRLREMLIGNDSWLIIPHDRND